MSSSWYDTAQVCLIGHIINSRSNSNPDYSKNFCDKCGAATITTCQHCTALIKGYYHRSRVIDSWGHPGDHVSRPSFCDSCGRAFPWTDKALEAARELADLQDNLTPEERDDLKRSVDDIVKDTPRAAVASLRIKTLLGKAGGGGAGALKDILVDLVSETVKKVIWG